jgi:hypothetical protein
MLTKPFTALLLILVDTLNIQLVYLANLATMILINLLYRRFDNLLRTISEFVTRGIVSAIREREKQDKKAVLAEINNDKVAGTARSTAAALPRRGNSVSRSR